MTTSRGDETPVPIPLSDAQMLLSWMDETFGNEDGTDWLDEDAAAVADALNKAIENFKRMRVALASPVAPAGVPPDEQMREAFADEVWCLMRKNAMRDDLIKPMNIHTVRALVNAMWEARAVLSAGAPAVPLQESVPSHLIAPGSTVPTALTVGTPSDDYDANPDGIKPGQDSHVRMDPDTGCWEPLA